MTAQPSRELYSKELRFVREAQTFEPPPEYYTILLRPPHTSFILSL